MALAHFLLQYGYLSTEVHISCFTSNLDERMGGRPADPHQLAYPCLCLGMGFEVGSPWSLGIPLEATLRPLRPIANCSPGSQSQTRQGLLLSSQGPWLSLMPPSWWGNVDKASVWCPRVCSVCTQGTRAPPSDPAVGSSGDYLRSPPGLGTVC